MAHTKQYCRLTVTINMGASQVAQAWKNPLASAGGRWDVGSILGRRSPGVRNGNPLQYFCLENPMDRGAWKAIVIRVTKSQTLKQLSTHTTCIPSDGTSYTNRQEGQWDNMTVSQRSVFHSVDMKDSNLRLRKSLLYRHKERRSHREGKCCRSGWPYFWTRSTKLIQIHHFRI